MNSVQTKNCVLDKDAVKRKLKRIALEIVEQNAEEQELIVAGVNGNGEVVARKLVEELSKVSNAKMSTITIRLNKKDPINVSLEPSIEFQNKVVLIVDDVANSGRTIMFALKPFLNSDAKKIQTVVLVERSHKRFPIQTDYAGLSIATTLQEHIAVETEGEEITGAWIY
jgi:pyrimidine operon attenuation protein/uracil phosphoribosyltransferase